MNFSLWPSPRTLVGIYDVPRSGSNFLAACLHGHPRVFAVSEREMNRRKPLLAFWRKRSILKEHGRQGKSLSQVTHVVFNKVQRSPQWSPNARFRPGTRFIFHVRNPLRVQQSRARYHRSHAPERTEWADTRENFETLLAETRVVLNAFQALRTRHASLLMGHEYFCCRHGQAKRELFEFLGLDPEGGVSPREFFQQCGSCGGPFDKHREHGSDWLKCSQCGTVLKGYGNFNPLRDVDLADVRSNAWRTQSGIRDDLKRMQDVLGCEIADYYWQERYDENLCLSSRLAA